MHRSNRKTVAFFIKNRYVVTVMMIILGLLQTPSGEISSQDRIICIAWSEKTINSVL